MTVKSIRCLIKMVVREKIKLKKKIKRMEEVKETRSLFGKSLERIGYTMFTINRSM